ncbi:MAG: hypothetical protein ACE5OZ_20870, partial [Candidatus Heimdallarchaeota archaeon]
FVPCVRTCPSFSGFEVTVLAEKISAEKQHLEIQYEKWQILAKRNISFYEWLKQTGLDDYLKEALGLARMRYKRAVHL